MSDIPDLPPQDAECPKCGWEREIDGTEWDGDRIVAVLCACLNPACEDSEIYALREELEHARELNDEDRIAVLLNTLEDLGADE